DGRSAAGRAYLRRGRRLRHPLQRLPHDRAETRRPGDDRGDPGGTRPGPLGPLRGGLHQRTRIRNQTERPARDRGVQAEPRRARLPDAGQLDQVHGRPFTGRHRFGGDRRVTAGHRTADRAADGESSGQGPRMRSGLCTGGGAGAPHRHRADGRQWLRRIPERDGAHQAEAGNHMSVITGLGVVAPNGVGVKEFWAATLSGRSGIGELDRFDTSGLPARLAGLVRNLDPAQHLSSRLMPQTDGSTRLALIAAQSAIEDADPDTASMTDYDMGVVTANASGGFEFTHREFKKLWSQGSQHVSAYESFAWFYAVNTGQISIRHGMRGPSCALVAEQAGGLDALGQARRNIRAGVPLMVSGGVDSAFDPWGWLSHLSS